MYERFYGFTSKPFAATPDPAFLFASSQHARALTLLEYGLESQATFALLTGEIGSGKTTLVRRLLRDLDGRVAVGLVSNSHIGFRSIHPWALSAFAIVPRDDSDVACFEALEDFFIGEYARGRRCLLVVDEAQNLSPAVLEELRLLSNINSEKDLVFQVLLVGQPELRETLARPELRQLKQRIAVDYHLRPLGREETHAYVRHRLQIAGGDGEVFPEASLEIVHGQTGGVPRLINQLCDLALVYGYAGSQRCIDSDLLDQVVRDRGATSPPAINGGPVGADRAVRLAP